MLNLSIVTVVMEFQGRVWGGCSRVIMCPRGHWWWLSPAPGGKINVGPDKQYSGLVFPKK